MKKKKVVLIGWDAADWRVISPLLDAGEMPALLSDQTVALMHQRLLAEATTAAYQDYFIISALAAVADDRVVRHTDRRMVEHLESRVGRREAADAGARFAAGADIKGMKDYSYMDDYKGNFITRNW